MDKIKSIVAFKMSELVVITRDGCPYSNVWVEEELVISNDLQSILNISNSATEGGPIIVVDGTVGQEMWSWFKFSSAFT